MKITLNLPINYSFNLSKDGKIENITCEAFVRSNNDIANNIAIELLKEEFYKTYSYQFELSHIDEKDGLYTLWWCHTVLDSSICCYGRITSSGAKISEDLF